MFRLQVACAGSGWVPPTRQALSDELLEAEHKSVKQRMLVMRDTAAITGETLVSDGATNICLEPILNLLSVKSGVAEFVKAQNCSGHVKDARFIADFMIEHIELLPDPHTVVQVLMDNASYQGIVALDRSSVQLGSVWPLYASRA